MRLPLLAAAGVLVAAMGSLALPAWAELSGPVNPPPASFQGMQYVDAQGCLFLRAGFGARTVWVPMIDQNRQPICGMAPTFGGAAQVAAAAPAPQPAPEPAPVAPAAPAPAPAPVAAPTPVMPAAAPAPRVAAPSMPSVKPAAVPPGRSYQAVPLSQTVASCAAAAPVLERVVLRTGGSALVCTRGDGTLSGWQPPHFPAGAGVGAGLGYVTATVDNLRGARLAGAVAPAAAVAAAAIPTPPKGWKLAWDDDRLNPMRGVGTAAGQAAQDRVWSRTIPATLVAAPVAPTAAPTARVSTMSAPSAPAVAAAAAPQGQAARYVQIGSFAVPANAAAASAQVQALGLPAAKGQMTRGGAVLQIVYAGPFATAEAAALALQQLKSAGFRDAVIR